MALYPDAASNPDTRGWVPELFWTPVQYLRVGAQYFNFMRYHGAVANYDGTGRNPSGNNTLFVYVWGAYYDRPPTFAPESGQCVSADTSRRHCRMFLRRTLALPQR